MAGSASGKGGGKMKAATKSAKRASAMRLKAYNSGSADAPF